MRVARTLQKLAWGQWIRRTSIRLAIDREARGSASERRGDNVVVKNGGDDGASDEHPECCDSLPCHATTASLAAS
jgi:hypothetical protein